MDTPYPGYELGLMTNASMLWIGSIIEHNAALYEVTRLKFGRFVEIDVKPLTPAYNPLQYTMVYSLKEYQLYKKL